MMAILGFVAWSLLMLTSGMIATLLVLGVMMSSQDGDWWR